MLEVSVIVLKIPISASSTNPYLNPDQDRRRNIQSIEGSGRQNDDFKSYLHPWETFSFA
jgi:hypothetical protein